MGTATRITRAFFLARHKIVLGRGVRRGVRCRCGWRPAEGVAGHKAASAALEHLHAELVALGLREVSRV